MDRWPSIREGFYDRLSILSIKNKKSLTDGSITLMKMRPKVSIDTIGMNPSIHRRLCPAMPATLLTVYFREKMWIMKEIGESADRECHLVGVSNYDEFGAKPVLPRPSCPTPKFADTYTQIS
jgi:hypothetical protein